MAIYGAQLYNSRNVETNIRYDAIGKNSEVFTVGDLVTVSSGVMKVVSGLTERVFGVCQKTVTMASDNQTVAKVKVPYIPANPDDVWFMGVSQNLTGDATDVGTYYGYTGTTGVQQVLGSGVQTGTSRQFMIVKVDPYKVGGTGTGQGLQQCLVRFVSNPAFLTNTI